MEHKKKHILFLPRWYPNKYDSMWGLFVKKHAQAASLYHQISVLYLEASDGDKIQIEEKQEGNIYTLYIYYPKPRNVFLYFLEFLKWYFYGYKRINTENRVDMLHVHILSRMGLLALLTKLFYRKPYVVTEHWSRYLPSVATFSGKTRIALTRFVVKYASCVMPVTANLASAMKLYGLNNKNYKVLANVVDSSFFRSSRKGSGSEKTRIIHVSTFEDKSKNISGILKMLAQLQANRRDFVMVFIGHGIDFDRLKALATSLNIAKENLEFTGVLENAALIVEYQKADFMLMNSNYENMPVVINEAFACGMPVLSTDVGGISEHLNKERGRLIAINKPKDLLTEFDWMLDNHHLFDTKKIRKYAQEHFSYEKIGAELSQVYLKSMNDFAK